MRIDPGLIRESEQKMDYILSKDEMRRADARTSEVMHIPGAVLMERAAIAVADRVIKRMESFPARKVLIVCGTGNNGGDGLAAGRILMERGKSCDFLILGDRDRMSPLCKEQLLALKALECERVYFGACQETGHDIIIDAIFGISLSRPVEGEFADAVLMINKRREEGAYVISVDIPSGIETDTGAVLGTAVNADETLCCGFLKIGNVLFPGAFHCGKLIKADIGITERSLEKPPKTAFLTDDEIRLPDRQADSNKGTYGKVLIFSGNEDIAGAAVLSARAALRTGCGMVRVFTHENNRTVLQTAVPEALVTVYGENDRGNGNYGDGIYQTSLFDNEVSLGERDAGLEEKVKKAIEWCSVIAAGPGMGTGERALRILKLILKYAKNRPLILDADALILLSANMEILSDTDSDVIITPHLREMSVLTGISVPEIKAHIMDIARDFASGYRLSVVLKDSRTVIAMSDGRTVINLNGNNGMATAGSGDVLTGIIASLSAQGADPERAACLGAAIHGAAGDRAAVKKGKHGMTSSDIIEEIGFLPAGIK